MNVQTNQPASAAPKTTAQPAAIPQSSGKAIGFSLRAKMIVAFLLIALIPLGISVFWNDYVTRKAAIEASNHSLALQASNTADQIDTFMASTLAAIGAEAQLPQVQQYMDLPAEQRVGSVAEERLRQTLQALLTGKLDGQAVSYGLLDVQGRNVFDTYSPYIGQEESGHAYFSQAMNNAQPYAGAFTFDPVTEEGFFYFSSRVPGANGEVTGVLRLRYDAEALQRFVKETGSSLDESFGVLLDSRNMILAHGDDPELVFDAVEIPEFEQELTTSQTGDGFFESRFDATDDQPGWAAVASLRTQPWSVVYIQPQEAFLRDLRADTLIALMIWIVAGAGLFVVAGSVADVLTNPLRRLIMTAQQVAAGALGMRAPVVSRDEIGRLAETFNRITEQLQDAVTGSEKHITERTRALENMVRSLQVGNEISRQITTILDLDELLLYIVNRIQKDFKFYYTQIYLIETESGDLVLTEGSGEVGRQLKERKHRLKAGDGIVGAVASANEYFLSNRVSESINFVANPLLPRTQSELAVPLRMGDRVLGVLDIQSDQRDRFAPEDVSLMQSIANQTAVVLENARLLAETQQVLQQVERLNRRLTGEGWDEFTDKIPISGYHFRTKPGFFLGPSSEAWLPPMKQAIADRQMIRASMPGNGHGPRAELAVPLLLRGEVIGVLGIKREEIQDWNEEEVSAVEAVANQVSLALENARLSKEQEKTIVQLKDIDRLKSEFLTSMSHELRTPLNSIIGFADVLLQGIDGELTDHALTDVQAIFNSGQHLLALINDILDLSKIEAGKMELVREPIDIDEIVANVLSSANSLIKDKPVEIVVDKEEEEMEPVYADKLRLNQVLINLVSNAVKFTDEGTITIRAEITDVEPDKMLISVIDTGMGIPSHMLGTVFERFRQVDSSTKRKAGGTGLGLAICRQLVEMHGGEVGVTSEEGVGSNFHFTIPLASAFVEADERELAV